MKHKVFMDLLDGVQRSKRSKRANGRAAGGRLAVAQRPGVDKQHAAATQLVGDGQPGEAAACNDDIVGIPHKRCHSRLV